MEWIKVGQRIPRSGQAVIVSDGNSVGVWRRRGFWPDYNGNGCSIENSSTQIIGTVSHWMPLPAPPAE